LVAVAHLYSQHALEKQRAKGTEIRDAAAYLARLRKKVTETTGEHHHEALRLIAEQPEANPEQLLEALLEATGESSAPIRGGEYEPAQQVVKSDRTHWLEQLPIVFCCLRASEAARLCLPVCEALQTAEVHGAEKARAQLTEAIRGNIYEPAQPEVMQLMFNATLKDRHGGIVSGGYFGAALKTSEQVEQPF
jgi:hypothetical protein